MIFFLFVGAEVGLNIEFDEQTGRIIQKCLDDKFERPSSTDATVSCMQATKLMTAKPKALRLANSKPDTIHVQKEFTLDLEFQTTDFEDIKEIDQNAGHVSMDFQPARQVLLPHKRTYLNENKSKRKMKKTTNHNEDSRLSKSE